MNFFNQKLFIPYDSIFFPPSSPNGKRNCLFFYGENVSFIETYNFLNIKKQSFRHVFVPTIMRPKSYLTPEYSKVIKDHKLIPVKGVVGDYSKVQDKNFFFDATRYLDAVNLQFKVTRYDTGIGKRFYSNFINVASGINKNDYDTTLLYAINIEKPFPTKIQYRKIYVLLEYLLLLQKKKIENLPFEKILLFIYNKDGGKYVKLYDVNATNNNFTRFKTYMLKLKPEIDIATTVENDIDHESHNSSVQSKFVPMKKVSVVANAIKNFIKSNPESINNDDLEKNPHSIISKSIAYNLTGDLNKAEEISKKIDGKSDQKKKEIIESMTNDLLLREKAVNTSTNILIKTCDIPKILDYQSPAHILNKRKIDFKENLKNDVIDSFNTLSTKDMPLKVKKVEVKEVQTGPSEIYKSIKDRYLIQLEDKDGEIHEVSVDLPHITENGTFLVNGLQKILVSQIVRFPIFFPKINVGRLESSYSVMKLNSKELTTGSYILAFAGSYKFPLIMWLAYKYGLNETLKEYGVNYTIN